MNEPITVKYKLSEKECLRISRYSDFSSKKFARFATNVTGFSILCGFLIWQFGDPLFLKIYSFFLPVVLGLALLDRWILVPRRFYRSEPLFQAEYTVVFSEEGMHTQTANVESAQKWGFYTQAVICPAFYLLYYSSGLRYTPVPRRAFANAEQEKAFEELLRRHIADVKKV